MFAQSLESLAQCILCTTHALLTATPAACEIIRTLKFLGISWFRRPGLTCSPSWGGVGVAEPLSSVAPQTWSYGSQRQQKLPSYTNQCETVPKRSKFCPQCPSFTPKDPPGSKRTSKDPPGSKLFKF